MGDLFWIYIWDFVCLCGNCSCFFFAIIYSELIIVAIPSSLWSFLSFAGAIVAKPRYKQNKIIENYNPRLTQADNIALTQAQLENESKKRFLSLPSLLSLLFWALVGALTTAMLLAVSGAINEAIEAQWAKSIELWFKDEKNALITWVVATLVLWVLNFINKRKQISVISIFMRLFLGLLGGFGVFLGVGLALDYSGLEDWITENRWIVLAIWPITTSVLWIFGVFGFIRKQKSLTSKSNNA